MTTKPVPQKYRTTNWKDYNAALKQRGAMLIWIDKNMQWNATPTGKRGSSKTYSDLAIQFCLTIKSLYGLGLRQTEGMVENLIKLANLDWDVPNFSTLSRRQKDLVVDIPYRRPEGGLHLLVDSTGIKILGEGEWKTKKHGAEGIIPVRKNAVPRKENKPGAKARNEILRATERFGRTLWKQWSGYHRRSLVETKMRCFKLLGERVMARDFDRQVAELQIRAALLNRFTYLGIPVTVAV